MNKKIFLLTSGFAAGILFRSFFDWGFVVPIFLLIITATMFTRRESWFLGFFVIGAVLGVMRFNLADRAPDPALLAHLGESVQVEGRVVGEPDRRDDKQLITLAIPNSTSRILATLPLYPPVEYSTRLTVTGQLVQPDNFLTDEGREFDYINYLAKDNIHFRLLEARAKVVKPGSRFSLIAPLIQFKYFFLERLEAVLPEPAAALGGGLILGVKQSLGEELTEAFRRAGLSHIIVLSGFNLTVIALGVFLVLARLPLKWRLGVAGGVIILFTLMVGAGLAVVRAALMALIGLLARWSGRPYEAGRALMVAGLAMIIWNPKVLVFDLGFQLSFLATLGVIYLSPVFETKLKFISVRLKLLKEILAVTLAAQVAVLPWLAYKIGTLSLISLLANALVLPIVPLAMLFVFIIGVLAIIFSSLGALFSPLAYLPLAYIIKITESLSALPLASINLLPFPFIFTGLLYASIFYWYRRQTKPILSHNFSQLTKF